MSRISKRVAIRGEPLRRKVFEADDSILVGELVHLAVEEKVFGSFWCARVIWAAFSAHEIHATIVTGSRRATMALAYHMLW